MNDTEIDFGIDNEKRRNAIIDFIVKNQGCNKQEVVDYCTKEHLVTRNPVMKILGELEAEKILTIGRKYANSKSTILTIDSKNLLVLLPKDFDVLYSRFALFIAAIKEWCVEPEITFAKRVHNLLETTNKEEIQRETIPLLYFALDIIQDVYKLYFTFFIHEKVDRTDHISKLYTAFFATISKIYVSINKDLDEFIPIISSNLSNKSLPYLTQIANVTGSHVDKLLLLINSCHHYSILDELFIILNFVWERNIDIAIDLYTKGVRNFEDVKDTSIVDKFHLELDNDKLIQVYKAIKWHLYWDEKIREAAYSDLKKNKDKIRLLNSKINLEANKNSD